MSKATPKLHARTLTEPLGFGAFFWIVTEGQALIRADIERKKARARRAKARKAKAKS
jgi:hypothetical protein